MKKKVLMVGIDGATWSVVTPMLDRLPGFRRFVDTGVTGKLESTTPPLSPQAWTSIFTGVNPGKHNIFGFVKRKKDSYFISPISSNDRRAEPLWQLLTRNNKRSILLNIPFSYPPDKVVGIMTSGLGTPSRKSEFVYPPEYREQILGSHPEFDVDFNEDMIFLGEDSDPLKKIERVTGAQIELAKDYVLNKEWEFFSVVFRSTDVIQHYFWTRKDIIFQCYKQLDDFLKWVMENVGNDVLVLMCSDHGFGYVHTNVYINQWLLSLGQMKFKKGGRRKRKNILPSAERVQIFLLKLGLRGMVARLKRSKLVEPLIRKLVPSTRLQHIFEIDWPRVKMYFRESSFGMFNVNLRGREPQGCVSEKEWEDARKKLIEESRKLIDPGTGKRVFVRAYNGEDIYHGTSENIPDVVLVPRDGYRLMGGLDPAGKMFTQEMSRNGDHTRYGIFGAIGDMVRSGTSIKGAKIYDLAPTILSALGLATPSEMDGRVLGEIYLEEFRAGLLSKRKGTTEMVGTSGNTNQPGFLDLDRHIKGLVERESMSGKL